MMDGLRIWLRIEPVPTLLVLAAMVCAGCGSAATDQENQASAEKVIRALLDYQSEHGLYPRRLDALVPEYLPTESDICWASRTGEPRVKRFNYESIGEGQDFKLRYPQAPVGPIRSDAAFEYQGSRGAWKHISY